METRANHVVIGSFVLVVVIGLFGFVLWLAKIEIDQEFAYYRVTFVEAVSGLSLGGDVRYNGIPVGAVTAIEIARDDPSKVQVTLEVARETPVRADTVAKLELQGITGVAFIQLGGGSAAAGPPKPGPNGELPLLRSERSAIQAFFAGAPELINRAIILVEAVTKLANEDNREAFGNILTNMDDLSSRLAKRGPELEQMLGDLQQIAGQTNQLMGRLNSLIDGADATLSVARGTLSAADSLMEGELRQTLSDLSAASQQFEAVGKELHTLVADNRQGLTAFSNDGLLELTRFLEEARVLISSASLLIEDLQSDPAQFLFGDQGGGFEAK
ncbi:MAG: MCE family protein [Rhodospirillaceae bacterium]|jgi:phospholipid/cholesterol/gamma-HCH transport system substrate-binding protein|nr:MCE family protein [Rhodospirillaceae bacterium]MBT3493000.1 MCE family protein [Rhodospirillaceae bacterium]MBT3778828.1 MCE family protein [Rhodospirillaceae bacterium]MBT3977792.1 MCE family protein [Rhodospirillaceae bacterium]MBT4169855.1 MCE family protein [Rhodospirillaceae bacterium]